VFFGGRGGKSVKIRGFCCGEVFLQEHFVRAVLYVQLRACPVGVYGRAFLDFRKMFRRDEKSRQASLDRENRDRRGLMR
jgi:hypothetical protein